jgi:NDP-sugar pyrophosphorylase family protein
MNSKISLFVLAAGMGSRYGGLKQMEGFGPSGETIIEYSIYDAVRAGFDKFVFVIRPDMEEAFKEIIMSKYQDKIDISYVFQSLDMVPDWYKLNPERVKPWGTGQALLVAKEALKEPFLVINGDDFYSQESFKVAAKFLRESCTPTEYAIPAYRLENVLSDNGAVKRGICTVEDSYLKKIDETFEVKRGEDGVIRGVTWDGKDMVMNDGDYASMNLFCVHNVVFDNLERRFEKFLKTNEDELTGEFLLPTIFSNMVEDGDVKFKIIETGGEWFGVTYPEDGPVVRGKLKELVYKGQYPQKLEL